MKKLWMLVGGNGSGKTTFYKTLLKPLGLPFINADDIARSCFPPPAENYSYEAAMIASQLRHDLLESGHSFCFETVFSHAEKIDFLAKAKALGYDITLVVLHVSSVDLNKLRITQRVASGGHSVPHDKVEGRIPRTLANVKTALPLCDEVWFVDNDNCEKPLQVVCRIKQSVMVFQSAHPPEWLAQFFD